MLAGAFIHMWGAFKRYLVRRSLGRSPLWNGRGGQNSLPIQCARNEPVRSNPPLKGRRKRLWRRRRFCGLKIAAHPNPIPPLAAAEAERILGRRWAFIRSIVFLRRRRPTQVSPPPIHRLMTRHWTPAASERGAGGHLMVFPTYQKKENSGVFPK